MLDALRNALAAEGHEDVELAIANAIGLLFQAHDATAGLIGNTLVRLVREPSIARTRESVRRLVAEVARLDPAVHNTRRYALRDVCLGGVNIRQCDALIVSLAAANLADDQQSWSFGWGRHACPASAMASIIATEAVIAVCERGLLPDRLPEPVTYRPLGNVRIPVLADHAGKGPG
jgi:cytochrome P450